MKNKFLSSLVLAAAVCFAQSAFAQEEHHHHKMQVTDAVFAKKAAAGGLTEVELGKLAQQNGDSQDVKDFGAKMVTDHGKANDNLQAVATKDSLTIPDKPDAHQQAAIDKLSKETGKQFDTDYIEAMLRAHRGDKALFTAETESAKNADLKQFAQDTLPVIQDHLSMIEGIAQAHGIRTGHHEHTAAAGMNMKQTNALDVDSGAAGKDGSGQHGNANSSTTAQPAPGSAGNDVGSSGESKSGLAPGGNATTNGPAPGQ